MKSINFKNLVRMYEFTYLIAQYDNSSWTKIFRPLPMPHGHPQEAATYIRDFKTVIIISLDVRQTDITLKAWECFQSVFALKHHKYINKSIWDIEDKFVTSMTFFCCSGSNRWEAFSEKLLLIISSTLSASTRSKLRIML